MFSNTCYTYFIAQKEQNSYNKVRDAKFFKVLLETLSFRREVS